MVILGGPGTLFGPLVGSLIIIFVRDIVSSFTDRWLIFLGLAYVCTVLFFPDGLLVTLRKWRKVPAEAMNVIPQAAHDWREAKSNAGYHCLPTNPGD